MSTTTIYPSGDGTIEDWTDDSGGTTNLWATVDEPVASPNDSDYIKVSAFGLTETIFLLLDDMPGDFSSMGGTIVVKFRGRRTSSGGGYVEFGPIGIYQSDETTALTDTSTPSTTTSLADYTLTLNVTGATSQAAWDGARLKIVAASGAVGGVEVTAIQVDVTYVSSGGTPGAGTNQNASLFMAM